MKKVTNLQRLGQEKEDNNVTSFETSKQIAKQLEISENSYYQSFLTLKRAFIIAVRNY